jgi:hypothetical protein
MVLMGFSFPEGRANFERNENSLMWKLILDFEDTLEEAEYSSREEALQVALDLWHDYGASNLTLSVIGPQGQTVFIRTTGNADALARSVGDA